MATKDGLCFALKTAGLKRNYKPFQDGDGVAILLEVRRPAVLSDGVMKGTEIDVLPGFVRVWTSQKKKAQAIATANRFRVRLYDGEAELYLPIEVADHYLHGLGAKIKSSRVPPVQSPEQRAKALAGLAAWRANKKALAANA